MSALPDDMSSLWNSSIRGDSGFVVDSSQSMLLSSPFPSLYFSPYIWDGLLVSVFHIPVLEYYIRGTHF